MTTVTGRYVVGGEDLPGFANATLTMVAVWKHGVSMEFNDEPRAIIVLGRATFRTGGNSDTLSTENSVSLGQCIVEMLDRKIVSARTGEDKSLSIAFDNGTEIVLLPNDAGYESYNINLPDGAVLVG